MSEPRPATAPRAEARIAWSFAFAIVAIVALGALSLRSVVRLADDAAAVERAQAVLSGILAVVAVATDAESGQRGYTLAGDERFLASYESAVARSAAELARLNALLVDERQRERFAALEALVEERLARSRRVIELRRSAGAEAAARETATGAGQGIHDEIRALAAAMEGAELAVLAERRARAAATRRFTFAVVGAGALASALALGAALLAVRRDLALRRRAERALAEADALHRTILAAVGEGLHGIDEDGKIVFENPAAATMLGWEARDLIGRPAHATVHHTRADGSAYPQADCGIYATLRDGLTRQVDDELFWRQDGTGFAVEYICAPMRGGDGEIVGAVVAFRDVTERQRAAAELRAAKERAETADRVKSAFLATMSHELRTPLNSILGFTGILLQGLAGPLNAEQAKQLGMVQGSSRHLLALINEVLDLSKIEAGELKVAREPFDLRAAVEKVVSSIRPLVETKELALRVELDRLPEAAVGDARRVERVLLNLLGNAVKFTERGEVALAAEPVADYRPPSGGAAVPAVRLRVSDTGLGIRPEELATLFQPFRQLDNGLARNHEGTGLGLAICRRLADLMGGEIAAESERGKGSTFTFTLPLTGATAP